MREEVTIIKKDSEVVSFAENKKWLTIPVETRKKLERNVWCSSCTGVVQIEKYTVKEIKSGIALYGSCNKCGHNVVRVID
jgi:hypothetical protein